MLSHDKLEAAVMKFIMDSKLESFDVEELAAELAPESAGEERESTIRRICGILDSSEFVARKHSSDLYYILDNFFRGTTFLRVPLSWNAESSSRRRVWNRSIPQNSMRTNSNFLPEWFPLRLN